MKTKLAIGLVAGALALGGVAALAQTNHDKMQHGPMHGGAQHGQHSQHGAAAPKGENSPSSAAYRAINLPEPPRETGLRVLGPGEETRMWTRFKAEPL